MPVAVRPAQAPSLRRPVSSFVRGDSPTGGVIRYPLASKNIVGVYQSRGLRPYQEDAFVAEAITIPSTEIKRSLRPPPPRGEGIGARGWEARSSTAEEMALVGLFDGHGGSAVSSFLRDNVASFIEGVKVDEVQEVVDYFKGLEGYYRRFQGGILSSRVESEPTAHSRAMARRYPPPPLLSNGKPPTLSIGERATLAFFKADREILTTIPEAETCGSTASVLLLHSLDNPSTPFFHSKRLFLNVAHCGDTRILLCPTRDGNSIPLTEKHHADSRVEAARLRRYGPGSSIVDAFGESRWMGAVENTRSFGDAKWKPTGVTSEPQITSMVISGTDHAYAILVTDGISTLVPDQEILDLVRTCATPSLAARAVVDFAIDLGSEDNCSCIVVPFAGWGNVGGSDGTRDMRQFRRREVELRQGRDR